MLKILSCAAERLTQLDCCHRHSDRRVLRVVLSTSDSDIEKKPKSSEAKITRQQEILVTFWSWTKINKCFNSEKCDSQLGHKCYPVGFCILLRNSHSVT